MIPEGVQAERDDCWAVSECTMSEANGVSKLNERELTFVSGCDPPPNSHQGLLWQPVPTYSHPTLIEKFEFGQMGC